MVILFCIFVTVYGLVESILVIDISPENAGSERKLKITVHCPSVSRFKRNILSLFTDTCGFEQFCSSYCIIIITVSPVNAFNTV